ncbi:hypothetical protein VKT23_020360 [Stygiomarasmius scandens]|uniref:Uncharacterized protein n=1 Tax=Marasmiellus scandens TaxID=2682957 RepID=A0ABR1IJG1_9AGAR
MQASNVASGKPIIRRQLRSGASFGEWIPTPPSFDLHSTVERVLSTREGHPQLEESTDHLHIHFKSLSLSEPTYTQLSIPESTYTQPSSLPLISASPTQKARIETCKSNKQPRLSTPAKGRSSLSRGSEPQSVRPPPIIDDGYQFTFTSAQSLSTTPSHHVDDNHDELPTRQRSRTAKKHEARKQKRQLDRVQNASSQYQIRINTLIRVLSEARPIALTFDSKRAVLASSGYIGRNDHGLQSRIWRLEEVVGPGSLFEFQLIRWDGSYSIPIVDFRDGRILCILIGNPPGDPSWQGVHDTAFEELRAAATQLSTLNPQARRRILKYLTAGYSFGGGQTAPQHFNLSARERELLEPLLSSQAFARIVGHVNAAFATWAPKLYTRYAEDLDHHRQHDPNFTKTFPSTVFAAATFNLDDQTLSAEHLDYFNFLFGLCAVTAFGNFDPTVGAHIILWDLQVVIEFPPSTSMLIPSCWCRHSNTAMSKDSIRHSFVQYSAGGLFRYDDDGMRTRASMSMREWRNKESQARNRVKEGLQLYSTLEELAGAVTK